MGSQTNIRDMSDDPDARPASKTSRKSSPKPSTKDDKDLRDRLSACFYRIAEHLDAREDDELAEIIREDAEVMAAGLVSLTRPLKPVRTVVLVLAGVVEPLLAFQRILRVLGRRFAERRMRVERDMTEVQPEPQAA